MADDKPTVKTKAKAPTGKGKGFDPETGKPWGVDPETDELVSVTPAGLQAYFGLNEKDADALYCRIAGINQGSVFFNPVNEPFDYRPPLNIADLKKEWNDKVQKILSDLKA